MYFVSQSRLLCSEGLSFPLAVHQELKFKKNLSIFIFSLSFHHGIFAVKVIDMELRNDLMMYDMLKFIKKF